MSRATSSGDNGAPQPFSPQIQKGETNTDAAANNPASILSTASDTRFAKIRKNGFLRRCWAVVSWTPPGCRWDPEHPPKFSMALNLLFAFAGTFTVANLYYNHPILNILAEDFDVSYEKVSAIPTVMQAGYAAGLLFLNPLGDVFRRRAFVLILVWFTATVWLGLCLTGSFSVFVALSFISAVTTVTPQLMLPLVGDLAPPARRATALSIVVSGLLLGILVARVLSGILTEYTSWRSIYWLSFGLQYLILILLWLFMPDYPVTNPGGLNYLSMLWSIVLMLLKHPVLVQSCIIGCLTSTTFTSYWTTLTFLLASPPYSYSPLVIGCFAFIGIGALSLGPFYARLVIDRFVPLLSVILGECMCLTGVLIGTYTGTFTVAGPIVQAFAIDLGLQSSQIANRSAIYAIEPKARNRVNTAFMVSVFCGQIIGTAVGNRLYAEGGWLASGSASVGFVCAALGVCFARAPWENRWVGWRGGWGVCGWGCVGFVCAAGGVCFAGAPWENRWAGWRGGWGVKRRDLLPRTGVDEEMAQSNGRDAVVEGHEMASGVQQHDSKVQAEELTGRDGEKHDSPVQSVVEKDQDKAYEAAMRDEEKKPSKQVVPSHIQQ